MSKETPNLSVLRTIVEHVQLTPLDGVTALLKLHSTVKPFPNPVTAGMSLIRDFRLAPLGVEAMTPDLTALRNALGNSGDVDPTAARNSQSVGDLVGLVS